MKHTPGPWHFHEQGDANFYAITHHREKMTVNWLLCLQHNGEQPEAEALANMQLIAAAPDMFALLSQALDEEAAYERGERVYGNWVEPAKTLIAGIKGGSNE